MMITVMIVIISGMMTTMIILNIEANIDNIINNNMDSLRYFGIKNNNNSYNFLEIQGYMITLLSKNYCSNAFNMFSNLPNYSMYSLTYINIVY